MLSAAKHQWRSRGVAGSIAAPPLILRFAQDKVTTNHSRSMLHAERSEASMAQPRRGRQYRCTSADPSLRSRSEEHTSELQSLRHLVCRLLLEKKKQRTIN